MRSSLFVLFAGTLFGICLQWTCVNSYSSSLMANNNTLINGTESEDCACNPIGSVNPQCNTNSTTAACICSTGYQGSNCTDCQIGYRHHSNRSAECIACQCNETGSLGNKCDSDGSCPCKAGYGGPTCDVCLSGYYDLSVNGCRPCRCQETVTKCLNTSKNVDSVDASMCHRCLHNTSWVKQCKSKITVCPPDEFLAPNGSCTLCQCSPDPLTNANGSRLCDMMTGECKECQGESCSSEGDTPNHFRYDAYIIASGSVAGVIIVILFIVLCVYCRRRCQQNSRRTPLPLWTIELRLDEDGADHGDDASPQDLAFSDIDVMYLDDSYLMESSDYFSESTDSMSRMGYHTLS